MTNFYNDQRVVRAMLKQIRTCATGPSYVISSPAGDVVRADVFALDYVRYTNARRNRIKRGNIRKALVGVRVRARARMRVRARARARQY
jgi:hypothetical protein